MTARVLALLVACSACRAGFDDHVDASLHDGVADTPRDAMHDGMRDTAIDGAAGVCPTFAVLCDGFETGDFSKWTLANVSSNATLVVETTTVHTGTYAAHGTVASGPSGNTAAPELDFALTTTGTIAIREWIYQPVQLINYDGVIIIEDNGGQPSVLIGGAPGNLWDVTENESTGQSVDNTSTTAVALNTWTCVEFDYTFGSPSTIALYLADSPLLQFNAMDPAPQFRTILVGAARAQAGGTETIIDDVVIAHQHIGCQ